MSRIPCLFVAEKPSIARTLSETLSKGQQRHRTTASQYNPCYDFDLDTQAPIDVSFFGESGKKLRVTVTSVSGHLMGIDFESKSLKNWKTTPHRELFDATIDKHVSVGHENIARTLVAEAGKCRVLVIWTDCDREGEAIGEEISIVCKQGNPNLIIKRARFSAANATDLWRAVNSLRELNQREIDAVNARSEIDLRLGSVFTRFQTISLSKSIDALESQMLSFGPCQFPTLGFIVSRYESILSFRKEVFYQIKMALKSNSAVVENQSDQHQSNSQEQLFFFNWERYRLFDQACALIAFEMCHRHPEATVLEVTRNPTTKRRPVPLSTVELQVRSSKWLRLDSETAMKAAETLYQRGIISYPRTETEMFSDTFDLRALIGELRGSPTFGAYASYLLDGNGFAQPTKGKKNDEAHPPIHPLKWAPDLKELPEIRVYEFVCRHFLACCSKDAIGSESKIKVKIAAETFHTKGLVIHERNYLDIYVYDKWGDRSIPDLREGDVFIPTSLELTNGETTPPELLSEAELIRLMDKNGIGTDATIADHIKTVQDRGYASKVPEKQNRFAPSNLGVALVRAYNAMGHEKAISKPELRSEMERDLMKICRGEKTKQEVVQETIAKYKQVYLDVFRKKEVLLQYVESVFMGDEDQVHVNRYDTIVIPQFSKCGTCSEQSLDLRKRSNDGKIGLCCSNRNCIKFDRTLGPLPNHGDLVTRPESCPICSYQVLTVNFPDRNKSWNICPLCFVEPPVQEIENIGEVSEMPCFKCTKSECQFSGGSKNDPVMPCPECHIDSLVLRKRMGDIITYYLACKGYPTCKGSSRLIKCAKDVSISDQTCAKCQAKKLNFVLIRTKVPAGSRLSYCECPNFQICDNHSVEFKEILEMEGFERRVPQQVTLPIRISTSSNIPSHQANQNSTMRALAVPMNNPTRTTAPRPQQNIPQTRPVTSAASSFTTASNFNTTTQPKFPQANSSSHNRQHQTNSLTKSCKTCGVMLNGRVSNTQQNPGRIFFKCDPCNIFEWGDTPQTTANKKTCKTCGIALIEKTSNSAQNPGRLFYRCDGCNFFEWADSAVTVQHASNTSQPSQLARSNQVSCFVCGKVGHMPVQCPQQNPPQRSSSSSSAAASMPCFTCGQLGHWASACPQQQQKGAGAPSKRINSIQPSNTHNSAGYNRSGSTNNYQNSKAAWKPSKPPRICTKCNTPLLPKKRKCGNCGETHQKKKKPNGEEDDEEEFE